MKILPVVMVIMSILFSACEEKTHNDTAEFSLLSNNTFILSVDRIAHGPDVQFPADSLTESDYTATTEDIQYNITFSENGQTVTVESFENGAVSGERSNNGETSKRYELDEGSFAGGRFIIWISHGHFEAEYTLYGSGVPIVRSERGRLIITG